MKILKHIPFPILLFAAPFVMLFYAIKGCFKECYEWARNKTKGGK